MTKSVRYKPVDFKARRKSNGDVEFSGISKVDVSNNGSDDYHLITFYLDSEKDVDLIFRPIANNLADSPFWIQPIAQGCPQSPAEMPGVVEPLFVSPNGKELTVINYNAQIEEMRFALRLIEKSSGKGHDYDPIMNNQNGGGGGLSWSSAATIGVGAAAVAAIAYVALNGNSN